MSKIGVSVECGMRNAAWIGPQTTDHRPKTCRLRRKVLGPWSLVLGPTRSAPRTPHPAFTLVELLVVIAILTILISLVTAGAQAARRRGAVAKAKATVASIETAISMYHGDVGDYPPTNNSELVKALTDDASNPDWAGPYMDFKEAELVNGECIDPWGKPYVYVSTNGGSPKHRPHSFDLYSLGPNGVDNDGVGDDIVNW